MRLTTLLIASVIGCGGDPLEEDKHIGGWATSASAIGVFAVGYEPLGFTDGAYQFPDPACPTRTDDGTTVVITGGCKASNLTWTGSATVVRGAAGARTVTFTDFGNDSLGGETKTNGTMTVTEMAADLHAFTVDVERTGGLTTTITYNGTVRGGYQGVSTWNGSGTVSRDGITINGGEVEATTVNQVRDSVVCPGEPMSGTTTLTSDGHTVVITYDGATDCTDKHTAQWSRDGEDKGAIEGITCATGRPSGFALVLVVLAFCLRRKR